MSLLSAYLRKQCLKVSGIILLILFVLMIGTLFASTLRTVARGVLPPELLFIELGLRSVDVLSILLPVSFFLGVLVTLSQLYRNQEAVVMHAFGVSMKRMILSLSPLAFLLSGVMLVFSVWVAPSAARLSAELISEASKNASLMGLTEGQFQPFYGQDSVIYVSRIDALNNRVENVFANINHADRVDTLTAEYGYQFEENGNKYIALFNGYRNEGVPGTQEYRLMKFARNDIRLPQLDSEAAELDEKATLTADLIRSDALPDKALLQWRLSPAISILVLFVLAVSLSRVSHREGKSLNIIVGLMAYAALINTLTIARSLMLDGVLPAGLGMWWVYFLFLAYGWWRIARADGPEMSHKGV